MRPIPGPIRGFLSLCTPWRQQQPFPGLGPAPRTLPQTSRSKPQPSPFLCWKSRDLGSWPRQSLPGMGWGLPAFLALTAAEERVGKKGRENWGGQRACSIQETKCLAPPILDAGAANLFQGGRTQPGSSWVPGAEPPGGTFPTGVTCWTQPEKGGGSLELPLRRPLHILRHPQESYFVHL